MKSHRADRGEVCGARAHRRDQSDLDAQFLEQPRDLIDVVTMPEAERGRPEQRAAQAPVAERRRARVWVRQRPTQPIKRLRRAPVLFFLIGRQLKRDDGDGQIQRGGETAGVILDKLGRAGCADDHRLRRKALIGVGASRFEKFGGVGPEIARLKRRVAHRRPRVAALDHREEKVGVSVALRGVQHIVQPLHAGGDAHCADMGRAFIGPDRQLHSPLPKPPVARADRAGGRRARRGRRLGRNLE